MLSKRLKTLSNFVKQDATVADVGCDHAYLLIDLADEKKLLSGFACDVNEGPLESARQNIEAHQYTNIHTRLGNGIDALLEADKLKVDTLVVAGMGGALITTILQQLHTLPNVEHLILQPNIGAESIRTYLKDSQFGLADELIVQDNDINYPVLIFQKDKENPEYNPFSLLVGPFVLANKTDIHIQYVTELATHWKNIIQQLEKSTTAQADKIAEYTYLITMAEEWLCAND